MGQTIKVHLLKAFFFAIKMSRLFYYYYLLLKVLGFTYKFPLQRRNLTMRQDNIPTKSNIGRAMDDRSKPNPGKVLTGL